MVGKLGEATVDAAKHEPSGQLDVDSEHGLTSDEVQRRIREYGYNEVPEKGVSPVIKFAKKFWGITPWMLEITVVLQWLLGKYPESYIILGLLFFNAVSSYIQEERANAALTLLKQKLRIDARLRRDGKWTVIPARELVPGDVIRLRAGDFVPADVRIVEGSVEVDQSALTGESLTIERKNGDVLFSGSTIRKGEITGIITATGMKTYFGRTVELVQTARPKLHIEEVISNVVRWLLLIVGATLSVGLAFAILEGMNLFEMIPLAVILLVSAIPVALPTMFTISMALGSLELSKKGVLITRLDATEDAATMNVVCVDKTGTITMNKLYVTDTVVTEGYNKEDVVLYGVLASQEANQDPIDWALISKAGDMGISLAAYLQTRFVPFDPSTRRTEATIVREGQRFLVLKGATGTIFPLCKNKLEELSRMEKEVERLSGKGFRVIAVAKGTGKDDLKLVGVAALYDRPRPDSPKLIGELKDLGISVKILTGDALPIAKEMAREVGLGENVTRISEVKGSINGDKGSQIVEESDGFAEIYPEDKYHIVKILQKDGCVVGMTGDGVNDAPALRQAEVGIAVSNATDVAKGAASAVLTTEGLKGIRDLVVSGRMIYQRIATWIINKMIRTFKRVVFIVLALILTGQYVVSSFNMILLLFLSDYVTLSIATDNVRPSKKPERWDVMGLVKSGVFLGLVIVVESLLILYIGLLYFGLSKNIDQLHTFVFDFLTFSGYFTVLTVRERRHFWESRPSRPLALALVVNTLIVVTVSILGMPGLFPIEPIEVLVVFAYSLATCLLLNDFIKVFLLGRHGVKI